MDDDLCAADDLGSAVDASSPLKVDTVGEADAYGNEQEDDHKASTYELSPTTKKLNAEQEQRVCHDFLYEWF